MRANPGGTIAPTDVIGRDALARTIWRALERQSVILSAERRMGKTTVIGKMRAEAPSSMLALYHDLEGIRSPHQFVNVVLEDVDRYLDKMARAATRARGFLAQIGGAELGGLKIPEVAARHWREVLVRVIDDLVEHQDRSVVLFWDEIPLMLHDIRQDHGEATAMQLLDTLRSARQMHRQLRMVFTGSIGLHHVLTSLRRTGYANDPTNDMAIIDVPPLSLPDAAFLAQRLLEDEGIEVEDITATARAIAEAVDGNAFFIHHVVDRMVAQQHTANPTNVQRVVTGFLTDDQDPWHLSHYRERIGTYYTPDEVPSALHILDILADAPKPLSFARLFDLVKSRFATDDDEMARHVLMLLRRDHYVVQTTAGAYAFRFPLIARSWRYQRGIGS